MDQRKEMGIYASDFSKKVKTSDVSEKALHPSPAFSASNARVNKIRMNKVVGKPLYTMQPVKSAGHRFREQKEARRKGLDLDEEAVLNANINKNMIAGGTGENKSSTAPLVAMLALGLFGAASVAHGNLFESLQSFVTQTEGVLPSQNIDVYVTPEAHAKQPLWLQRQR
jgi:hypothetical protein